MKFRITITQSVTDSWVSQSVSLSVSPSLINYQSLSLSVSARSKGMEMQMGEKLRPIIHWSSQPNGTDWPRDCHCHCGSLTELLSCWLLTYSVTDWASREMRLWIMLLMMIIIIMIALSIWWSLTACSLALYNVLLSCALNQRSQ